MEVHHHPHVEKKRFKEYFFEFLMIFLAVSLGFFAESFREHLVNKEHEKQYITSFYSDLQDDQKGLPKLINNIQDQQLIPAKSLPALFSKTTTSTPADSIYFFLRKFMRQQGIKSYITNRTIEQIENAGEMRLISEKKIADSLVDYYKAIGFIDYLQQTLLGYKAKLLDNFPLIFKSGDYVKAIDTVYEQAVVPAEHLYLSSAKKQDIDRILIQVEEIRALSNTIKNLIEQLLNKNEELQILIESRYHLKNE